MQLRLRGRWHSPHASVAAPAPPRHRPGGRGPPLAAAALALLLGRALLAAPDAGAQAPPDEARAEAFVHESWMVQDGLPVNSVTSLLQSRDGYLWIATFDGLVRFDGARFTVFNTGNSPGLPSNRIVRILEARDGALWLVTEQGKLGRYRAGVFTHVAPERVLTHEAGPLLEDASGTLWVGTRGGVGVIRSDRFVPVAAGIIRSSVSALLQRPDGSIWVGTVRGEVYRIRGEDASLVTTVVDPSDATIHSLQEGLGGTLWIGTGWAAWRYDGRLELAAETPAPQRVRISPRTGELWMLTVSQVYRQRGRELVRVLDRLDRLRLPQSLVVDADGAVLYTSGPELHREGRHVFTLPPGAGDAHTGHWHTDMRAISAVLQDREGSLWLGTRGTGLHRLKPADFFVYSEREGLSHRNVTSVFEDRSGAVWVGTLAGGTSRIANGRVTRMTLADGDPRTVFALLQDRTGRVWLGSDAGVRVCAPPGGRCVPVSGNPFWPSAVRAMHEEPDGALWFGSEVGLFRLEDGHWTRLDVASGAPAATVRAFLRTRDGALWMGTNGGGLARYHAGRFTRIGTEEGLPIDLVRSLHEDEDGWLWVGTEGRGLARLDPREWGPGRRGGRTVAYRMQDGLFDETIHQILEDDLGRLWMSTNRGIFWVERQELLAFADGRIPRITSISYTERDGLRNREANGGSQPAGVRTRDGRLWFATQDGVAVVDPARIRVNALPPTVVIEQVTAGGSVLPVLPGAALRLGVEQRDLEIEYTALSFLAPGNVRFRYRLEGYDRDWVEAGTRRTAFYTSVPPGHYTFQVMASNNDGVWNEEGATLELQMAPRIHETGWFRLLVLLAAALLVAGGVGLRVRGLRARTRELAGLVEARTAELRAHRHRLEVQAEQLTTQNAQLEAQTGQLQELDRAKSRFFANVSHEFRTPLTLTIGPLEDLHASMAAPEPSEPRRQLEMALRNARRLLRLVNQILDVAKLEAGQMKLRTRRHDLAGFARGVAAAFAAVAGQRRVTLEVLAPPGEVPVRFDADAMEKVLGNLLSNAFNFTPEGGRITVEVESETEIEAGAGVARLRVSDSGPGIPPEHLPHVFERFYQVDESATRAQPGTGIGLALAKELVELHGGSIAVASGVQGPPSPGPSPARGEGRTTCAAVESAVPLPSLAGGRSGGGGPAGGATFTVTLPLGGAHLHDEGSAPDAAPEGELATVGGRLASLTSVGVDLAPGPRDEDGAAEPREDVTTLLVVDDSADLRAYVRSAFEARYRVVEAAGGAEGIALARELLPDLVISDVMMPGTDGTELCRTLKADPETDFIPVILLTARAAAEDRVAGLVGGADDYLAKPFEMRELAARVENLIASRRRLRERFARDPAALPPAEPAAVLAEPAMEPADRDFVERLRAEVEAHLGDPEFGVAELARALFVDRTNLFRRTRELLGESPSDLIRRARLERAAPLLREGSSGVGEIAYAVGFNSASYFCRCFREQYGMSPSELRAATSAAR